jgi:hypothetical protein
MSWSIRPMMMFLPNPANNYTEVQLKKREIRNIYRKKNHSTRNLFTLNTGKNIYISFLKQNKGYFLKNNHDAVFHSPAHDYLVF